MTRMLKILLALVITCSSSVSFAYYTAAQLRTDCRVALQAYEELHEHKHIVSHLESGNCIGFITGVIDAHDAHRASTRDQNTQILLDSQTQHFCLPEDMKLENVIQVVVKDLNDHPDVLKYSAIVVILDILKIHYPCDKSSKPHHLTPEEL